MNGAPQVSVVIPAYNAESTLAQTLDSVLAQTFAGFEVIVVDDGSTDATSRVAGRTADPRVRVATIVNSGVARARNHGTGLARGELIAFLDADDLWRPTKLQRQLDRLAAEPSAGLCVTAASRIDRQGRELGPIPLRPAADACSALLLGSMVLGCVSSGLLRRAVLERVGGFNPAFSQCADWDLWLRISAVSQIALVDEPLVLYRTAAGNMSSNIQLLERDTFAVLDAFFAGAHGAAYGSLRSRAYAAHWMICAGSYLHAGARAAAVRCLLAGLRADPRTIGRPIGLPARWLRRTLGRSGPPPLATDRTRPR